MLTPKIGTIKGFWTIWTDRSDRGAGLLGDITPSFGLQIEHSIYAFRSSQRDLRNGAVQFAI